MPLTREGMRRNQVRPGLVSFQNCCQENLLETSWSMMFCSEAWSGSDSLYNQRESRIRWMVATEVTS